MPDFLWIFLGGGVFFEGKCIEYVYCFEYDKISFFFWGGGVYLLFFGGNQQMLAPSLRSKKK